MSPASQIREVTSRIFRQARRFVTVLFWLLKDSMCLRRAEWIRILIATFFMVGSNAFVLGVVFFYVRLLESGYTLHLLGLELVTRESVIMLALFAVSLLVAMVVYSISDYVLRTDSLNLYRRYHEESVKRACRLLECLPDRRATEATKIISEHGLRRLVNEYSRLGGWALRFLATAVPAIVIFFGAFFGLIMLDRVTTVIVAFMGLLVIAGQYPSNVFAATASNISDESRSAFKDGVNDLADRACAQLPPTPNPDLSARIDAFFEQKEIARYAQADVDRFRAMELSALWMRTGGGIVLAAVLFMIGSQLLRDGADWATLIAYATLLRLMLANATSVFRAITMFSRFLPYIQHARAFVIAAEPALAPPVPPSELPPHIKVNAEFVPLRESKRSEDKRSHGLVSLSRGLPAAMLTNKPLGKDVAMALQGALAIPQDQMPDISVLPLSTPQPASAGAQEDNGTRSPDADQHAIVLIAQQELAAMPPEEAEQCLKRLGAGFLLIVYSAHVASLPQFGERHVLVRNNLDEFYWTDAASTGLSAHGLQQIKRRLSMAQKGDKAAVPVDDDEFE
jgi:ABC-type multidrug transport system fused ATPase/permease subunit